MAKDGKGEQQLRNRTAREVLNEIKGRKRDMSHRAEPPGAKRAKAGGASATSRGKSYVGCSGWSYAHWRGPVYDAALSPKEWFSDYARRFRTVEVNNTFYRLPEPATFDGWRDQAPTGFVYALKVNQYGTHRRRLREPRAWLPNYIGRVVLLGPALGPSLVQLPPRWKRDTERLSQFLEVATSGELGPKTLRWAVEFRDPSWLHDDSYEVLRHYHAALCIHDLLPDHPWTLTSDWAYCRFHGPDPLHQKYSGDYGPSRLAKPARALSEWQDQGCDVYAYFNNDEGGSAVRDATWLRQRLGS
jgi:uncharacterized protein YecE (DUF72 family)